MNGDIAKMFAEGVKPPDRRPPWQWAEEHIASIPYSPMPGRFRSDNSPWVREVMEAIVDPRVKLVSILASVQSSKTTVPELTLCYIIANLPGPTLWLDQTDEDAKDQSESRVQKLFDKCEPVKLLFHRDRHKKRNHTIHFANGMTLWILGAGRHCFFHYWSSLNIKDTLARLRRNQDPANGPTWEVSDDIDEDYLSQMESEHRGQGEEHMDVETDRQASQSLLGLREHAGGRGNDAQDHRTGER